MKLAKTLMRELKSELILLKWVSKKIEWTLFIYIKLMNINEDYQSSESNTVSFVFELGSSLKTFDDQEINTE